MLGSIGKVSSEDYLDFKRAFHKKLEKFKSLLDGEMKPVFDFKNHGTWVSRVSGKFPGSWCAFYFYDDKPKIHVNEYPNVNLSFEEQGVQLSVNAETKPALERVISRIVKAPEVFDKVATGSGELDLLIFYKLQFRPMDNFIWNLIPGWPKRVGEFSRDAILASMRDFKTTWADYKNTMLFEMKNGMLKHSRGRPFNEKEIEFAHRSNPKPSYVIRFAKFYQGAEIAGMGKKIETVQ